MIVYQASKLEFLEDVYKDRIAKKIKEKIGRANEKESWIDTSNYMERILRDSIFPNNITVALELILYNTQLRVDFIITGLNAERKNTIIVMEFKRWESAKALTDRDDMVETKYHGVEQHPSYQALSYSKVIKNFYAAVEDHEIVIKQCSCLHRYEKAENDAITNQHYQELLEQSPAFLNGENDKLKQFISENIKYGDDGQTLELLEKGGIRPSKQLQDNILKMIQGKEVFSMVHMQKDVLENAKKWARLSKKDGKKRVYIVEGGPGTGKSVIAINLLGQLLGKSGMNCQYVTKNQAVRDVLSVQLKGTYKRTEIDALLRGSGCYMTENKNKYDALIVDEAHRVTEKTGFYRKGDNQIKEIINASRFSMFFIDPKQKVHIDDYCTTERIEYFAKQMGAEVYHGKLTVQLRCSGAEQFITWVESGLQYEDAQSCDDLKFLENYDVQIFDDPNDLRDKIRECNKDRNRSRIVAGYCWDWISKDNPEGELYDIVIPEYNFKMKWNFDKTVWAIDENSVEQAGCIHTAQGLEFDYIGVIIGNDLKYKNGKIVTDYTKRAKIDRNNGSLKGIKKMYEDNQKEALSVADEIIKNTYRTLLTRGQKGCYIYCEDKALAEYLKSKLISGNGINYNTYENYNSRAAEDNEEYAYN